MTTNGAIRINVLRWFALSLNFFGDMIAFRRYGLFFASILLLFVGCLATVEWTRAQMAEAQSNRVNLVRGIIVKFKDSANLEPSAVNANPRERAKSYTAEVRADRSRRQHAQAARVIAQTGMAVRSHRDLGSGHHVIHFERPQRRSQALEQLRTLQRHPDVLYAEPDELMRPLAVFTGAPNDQDYAAKQWYFQSSIVHAGASNMQAAWGLTTGSASVVVAVLDTGILAHSDLQGRYLPGYDFVTNDIEGGVAFANDGNGQDGDPTDPGDWISASESQAIGSDNRGNPLCDVTDSSWHGTFVAGMVGASSNNGIGIAGANWVSPILPVRVAGKCGAYASNIIDGMRWAAGLAVSGVPNNALANKARVINVSFGGSGSCGLAYQAAVDEIIAAGSLIVVAAGNEYGAVSRPGNCKGVMTVAAARHDGLKANYSNFGSEVAILAPGGSAEQSYVRGTPQIAYPGLQLWSTSNTGKTRPVSDTYIGNAGTSFAAPLVAGVASLMLSVNSALSVEDLMARIKASARPHVRIESLFDQVLKATTQLYETGALVDGKLTIGTSNCTSTTCGAGLLDAAAALAAAAMPAVNIVAPSAAPYGLTITLDGSASGAALGASLTRYSWVQMGGIPVTLENSNTAIAKIKIPASSSQMSFKLEVTDSLGRSSSKTIEVTAREAQAPTVLVSVIGNAAPGSSIQLSGDASYSDLDATLTQFSWTQPSGTPVIIQNAASPTATVTLPSSLGTFVFRLTVTDSLKRVGFKEVSVVSNEASAPARIASGGALSWPWGLGLGFLLLLLTLAARRQSTGPQ